jgi:hypothetical protein
MAILTDSASKRFSLNKYDWKSIGWQVIDGCGGAILTVIESQIIPGLPTWGAMLWNTVLAKLIRKYISEGKIPAEDIKK